MMKKWIFTITVFVCIFYMTPFVLSATYSIVAYDKENGQMGVAVQSHWFSVGSSVTWAESGVGAVATQSFVEPSYGPLGLALMRSGKTAQQALAGLLAADPTPDVRQVAMVDINGNVAAHTGKLCIDAAGNISGNGFSCQANMMEKNTVWKAMAHAYENTKGELVDRLLAALEAAEAEGGDIRGRQSAAILVVKTTPSGAPWEDRVYDLRIEDHPTPLVEMRRLVTAAKAYNHMNAGDGYLTDNNVKAALDEYTTAMNIYPGNPEMFFWPAVTMAATGKVEESLPLFKKVFQQDKRWAELLKRLPKANQFPNDEALLKKILSVVPEK
ncbi:MAG: DUF1028 domain-containing protein [Candidatus Aminicenantes bacterium]|nr:DUF1028 domain-containing protein [Candidatus Aminicenantes bacterium]